VHRTRKKNGICQPTISLRGSMTSGEGNIHDQAPSFYAMSTCQQDTMKHKSATLGVSVPRKDHRAQCTAHSKQRMLPASLAVPTEAVIALIVLVKLLHPRFCTMVNLSDVTQSVHRMIINFDAWPMRQGSSPIWLIKTSRTATTPTRARRVPRT
jgi:hypothetical protein